MTQAPASRRPMKVATVVPSLRGGGLERLARDLVISLDRDRFEPAVFCLNGTGVFASDIERAGIPVRLSSEGRLRIRGLPLALIRHLAAFGPDIVHAHSGTWFPAAVATTVLRRPKLVFTDHGRYPPEPRGRALVERWCHSRTAQTVAVASALAEYLRDFLKLDRAPLVIENGVPLRRYRLDDDGETRRRVRAEWGLQPHHVIGLAVGRLESVKDHAGLIRAFAGVAGEASELRIAIAGTGSLEADLRGLARDLGVGDGVLFLGFRDDIPACMQAADFFVVSSRTEGLPVTLLEAFAARLPVLSTAVGGIPAAMDDPPAGCLVPPDDPAALAEQLLRLTKSPALRSILSQRSEARSEAYSLEGFTSRYSELYRTVLFGGRS